MRHGVTVYHHEDSDGKPTGAIVTFHDQQTVGLDGDGVSVEDVIEAAHLRLTHLADGLRKNTKKAKAYITAVEALETALAALEEGDGA